jgi:predicted ATP-grasp superfamily ATP-dependent carboligase
MSQARKLLIVGASTRAAASVAAACGYEIHAIDLFLDRDLQSLVEATAGSAQAVDRLADIPSAIRAWLGDTAIQTSAAATSRARLLFCGGVESLLDPLVEFEEEFVNLGPSPTQIARLRSHSEMLKVCRSTQIEIAPRLRTDTEMALARTRTNLNASPPRWLAKSATSAGGCGIRRIDFESDDDLARILTIDEYIQPYIDGEDLSVIWKGGSSSPTIVGLFSSLATLDAHSSDAEVDFRYRGSQQLDVAQFRLRSPSLWQSFLDLAQNAVGCTGALNFLQADFRIDRFGTPWLLEFNPRWTASMECLRKDLQMQLLGHHRIPDSEGAGSLPNRKPSHDGDQAWLAKHDTQEVILKRIVYAEKTLIVTQMLSDALYDLRLECHRVDAAWALADIPTAEVRIEAGQPVCTLLLLAARTSAKRFRHGQPKFEDNVEREDEDALRCLQALMARSEFRSLA